MLRSLEVLRLQIIVKMSATELVGSHKTTDFSRYMKVN